MSRKDSPKMMERAKEQARRAEAARKYRVRQERISRCKQYARFLAGPLNADKSQHADVFISASAIDLFEAVEDYRDQAKIQYVLSDILILVFLAICHDGNCEFEHIADHIDFYAEEYEDMDLIQNAQVPSHDTIRTIFCNMDPVSLRENSIGALRQVIDTRRFQNEKNHHLAMDGKEIPGTGRAKNTSNPARNTNVFNVYDVTNRINLIAEPIDGKTNEIPAGLDILFHLNIVGKIITADALHTKAMTCELIEHKKAVYVFPVKDKRTLVYKPVDGIFNDPKLSRGRKTYEFDDRVFEVCKLGKTRKIDDILSVRTLVKMVSYTRGKEDPTVLYFISNGTRVEDILDAICNRWAIENDLHKLKDSDLINEDGIRFRDETALANMAVMTDLIAALVQMVHALGPDRKLMYAKRCIRAYPLESLERVLEALGDEEFIHRLREGKKSTRKKAKKASEPVKTE